LNDTLSDLLRQTADAAQSPRVDVEVLVRQADRRQRRRRLTAGVTSAVLIGTIVGGSVLLRDDERSDPDPAPLVPSPTVVDQNGETPSTHTRPLVYAEGSTIHVGDRDITANARVMFVDVTDDGVLFMTEQDDKLWFDDGSKAEVIGTVHTPHVGTYDVFTGNPGSLVAWFSRNPEWPRAELQVYDTARHEMVAEVRDPDSFVLGVAERFIYTNPDWSETPGCWVVDERPCPDPQVFRYEAASDRKERIGRDTYEAELRDNPRMLVGAETHDTGVSVDDLGAPFTLVGRRLVPTDPALTRTNGDPVELRWPSAGAVTDPPEGFWVVQWLDDDRIVLAGYQDTGAGPVGIRQWDAFGASFVDLLVCTLPTGVCELAGPRSVDTPYMLTGGEGFFP
jgi:hypothetical protein